MTWLTLEMNGSIGQHLVKKAGFVSIENVLQGTRIEDCFMFLQPGIDIFLINFGSFSTRSLTGQLVALFESAYPAVRCLEATNS